MKTNLLPNLSRIELVDKQGNPVQLLVKLFEHQGRYAVFIEDSANGVLARNAGTVISQLVRRLALPVAQTSFYRHIYLPHQGSVFGCFQMGWGEENSINHYTFSMMSPLVDDLAVRRTLKEGKPVSVSYGALRNLSSAV